MYLFDQTGDLNVSGAGWLYSAAEEEIQSHQGCGWFGILSTVSIEGGGDLDCFSPCFDLTVGVY